MHPFISIFKLTYHCRLMPRGNLANVVIIILIASSMFAIATAVASMYMIYTAGKSTLLRETYEYYTNAHGPIKNATYSKSKDICIIYLNNGTRIVLKHNEIVNIENFYVICERGAVYLVHR